jgi:hypothetical protein
MWYTDPASNQKMNTCSGNCDVSMEKALHRRSGEASWEEKNH